MIFLIAYRKKCLTAVVEVPYHLIQYVLTSLENSFGLLSKSEFKIVFDESKNDK